MSHTLRETTKKIQRIVGAKPDGRYGPNTAARILSALTVTGLRPQKKPRPAPELSDELDNRTLKNLKTLESKAQAKFLPFIRSAVSIAASMGCDYKAISGQRGEAEQNRLYAKGRTTKGSNVTASRPMGRTVTRARFGSSNHNFGIALDFGVFAGGRYLDSSNPKRAAAVHKAVASVAKKYGINWGGNWRSPDIPHFEVDVSLTFAQKRSRSRAGKSMFS